MSFIKISMLNGISNSNVIVGKENEIKSAAIKANNKEWNEARECVDKDEDLSDKQKQILKEILTKAENQNLSADKKSDAKSEFEKFVTYAGKTAISIVRKLSAIKSVAKFFGIGS